MKTFGKVVLFSVLGLMVAGAGLGCWLKWDTIVADFNSKLGDNEKVTFTQVLRKSDLKLSSSPSVGTIKDGVITVDASNGNAAFQQFTVTRFNRAFFGFLSYSVLSAKVVGSGLYNQAPANLTTEVNIWKSVFVSGDYRTSGNTPLYSNYLGFSNGNSTLSLELLHAAAGDIASAKNFMAVDLVGLGVSDAGKACAVWGKLAGTDYFEGDKSFTKGQIKKAIKDYDDAQAKLTAGTTSTSAAAA